MVAIPYYAIKKVVWVSCMNDVTHSGGKMYQMGDVIHGLAPVVIPYYAIKKGSLGVMHEWCHPFFDFTHSGGKMYQMGDVIHGLAQVVICYFPNSMEK